MVKKTTARKPPPPSRLRYEEKNPVIAIRVRRDLYSQLVTIRKQTGQSWADLLEVALKLQKPVLTPRPPNKSELDAAWKRGWEAAKEEYAVVYLCKRCGVTIELVDPKLKLEVALMLYGRSTFMHDSCIRVQ